MKNGPGRHLQSSSRCHRISTRCTGAAHSWQGGEASAMSCALVMREVSVRCTAGAIDHLSMSARVRSRRRRPPCVLALGGDTDGRVGGAVAVVAATSLHDLEEQAGTEERRVEVQQLSFANAVVEDA